MTPRSFIQTPVAYDDGRQSNLQAGTAEGMGEWEQLHWSGQTQAKPDRRRRIRPNLFARLARVCARNSTNVFVVVLFLTALSASFAALTIRVDLNRLPQILLDPQTRNAQGTLSRNFPGIETTFVADVMLPAAEAARARAVAIAAALSKRTDLFAGAFVPGTGDFYTKYAILFRDAAQLQASVAHALQMQALYRALGSAPDLLGFTTLVGGIGRALADGRSPPGLAGLLLAASAAVEGEMNGTPRPLDWTQLAGLSAKMESTRWFVIATPLAGKEREARLFAIATSKPGPELRWYFPSTAGDSKNEIVGGVIVPIAVALFLSLALLLAGLGALRCIAPVILTVLATLGMCAGLAGLIAPELDAVSWSFAPICVAPALLFSIVLVLAHIQSRLRGAELLTAIMLAAQRQGALLLALAVIAGIFWYVWLFRQLPSLAQTAAIAAMGITVSLALSLTLVPAVLYVLDTGFNVKPHWLDRIAAQSLGPNLRNVRQIFVLLLLAASMFCGVFVPGLRFGDVSAPATRAAPLDTPAAQDAVHFLLPAGDPSRRAVEELAKLPQTGAIRWVEQFLPADPESKLQYLRRLDGFLAGLPPPRATLGDATLGATVTALEESLRQISNNPAAATDLREASHRLRRALGVYATPRLPPPSRVRALEAALFSGLGELPVTAAKLAALGAPAPDELDEALHKRFVSANGLWRIEVLPKPDVRRLVFAGAMRKFSPQAAGTPVVALARSEIMHHETALALAMAFAAAAIAILIYLRDVWSWAISLFPVLFGISLSAVVVAASGQIVIPAALAATVVGMAMCLSMSIMLVLWERQPRGAGVDTSFRAAVLPPLTFLGATAPLMMSTIPAVAAFGRGSALFLLCSLIVNVIIVPQACAWVWALPSSKRF
jgi:hypothetical protein